ncbi:hypothetical protein ACTNEO_05230 [Gracilibacillus sp. HCP3S3_G5_1]|uniref:hypothetical protein n=1 Tax=unclassified Gracilibacillus TaxID=2625209 RepID=UPI003F8A0FDC
MDRTNFQEIVSNTFQKHGVENKELENAITDILEQTLDSRRLAKRIWEDVIENYERDQRIKAKFR